MCYMTNTQIHVKASDRLTIFAKIIITVTSSEFENLYHRHYASLYIYAGDFIDSPEVCRDIVADVFVWIWNNRINLTLETEAAYLRRSVRNACMTWMRRQECHSRYVDYFKLCNEIDSTLEDSVDNVDELWAEVSDAISRLPERTRFILKECAINEKSYKEVAEMLGITPSGVKQHIIKAYSFLREYFKNRELP